MTSPLYHLRRHVRTGFLLLVGFILLIPTTGSGQERQDDPCRDTQAPVGTGLEAEPFVPALTYVEVSEQTVIGDALLSTTPPALIDSVMRAGTLGMNNCNEMSLHSGSMRISLDLGETYNYGLEPFNVDVTLKVEGIDYGGGGSTVAVLHDPVNLVIDQNTPEQVYFLKYAGLTLSGHEDVDVYRITVTGYTVTGIVASDVRVIVRYDDEYALEPRLPSPDEEEPVLYHVTKETELSANPVTFAWQVAASCSDRFPSYELQILRLYNTEPDYEDDEVETRAVVDWSQALTLEVAGSDASTQSADVTLAEGTGWYLWRVRPIGSVHPDGTRDSRNWGVWTEAPADGDLFEATTLDGTGGSFFDSCGFFFRQPEDTLNWSYGRTMVEGHGGVGNRMAESMTFVTPLGSVAQTQVRVAEDGTFMTTNGLLDFQGRPTLSQMSSPHGDSTEGFSFRRGHFPTAPNTPYTAENFDTDVRLNNPEQIALQGGSLYDYYDGSTSVEGAYVPTSNGYPFARTLMATDGSGRASEIGGVGRVFRIGGEGAGQDRTMKIRYSSASEAELVRLFGDEAPADSSVYKVLVTGPNKVTTVQWVHGGRTIATAYEAGMGDTLLVPVADPTESVLSGENIDTLRGNRRYGAFTQSTSKRYAFSRPTEITLNYSLNPDTLRAQGNCFDTCATCDYRVQIYVHYLDIADSTRLFEYKLGADPCGAGQSIDTSITLTLPAGSYIVERRLAINTIDSTTIDSEHPVGVTYAEQFRENVAQLMIDSIMADDSITTVIGFLDSDNLEGLYAYLGIHPDSVATYGTYTIITECCEITFPILSPDCGFDPCPGDSIPDFEAYLFEVWGEEYPNYTLDSFFLYDRNKVRWVSGTGKPSKPFQTLVQNMLSETDSLSNPLYDCKELWNIWKGLVDSWDVLKTDPSDTTKRNPDFDLYSMFLNAAGRYLIDSSYAPYGSKGYLTWGHRYIPADVLINDEGCKQRVGYDTLWRNNPDSSIRWQGILNCWEGKKKEFKRARYLRLGQDCDLSDTLNGDPTGEVDWDTLSVDEKNDSCLVFSAREVTDACQERCESRRTEWAWEIFRAYRDAEQPISYESALCAADDIVDSCMGDCNLTVFGLDSLGNGPIDSIGAPEEWDAIQRVFLWEIEAAVPLEDPELGTGCAIDSSALTEDHSVPYEDIIIDVLNRELYDYWARSGGTMWSGMKASLQGVIPDSILSRIWDSTLYVPPYRVDANPPRFEMRNGCELWYVADTVFWSDLYPDKVHPMVTHLNNFVNEMWSLPITSIAEQVQRCQSPVGSGQTDEQFFGYKLGTNVLLDSIEGISEFFGSQKVPYVNGTFLQQPISQIVGMGGYPISYLGSDIVNDSVWKVRQHGREILNNVVYVGNSVNGQFVGVFDAYGIVDTGYQYCHTSDPQLAGLFDYYGLNKFTACTGVIIDTVFLRTHGEFLSGTIANSLADDIYGEYTSRFGYFLMGSGDYLNYRRIRVHADTVDTNAVACRFGDIRFFVDPTRKVSSNACGIMACPDVCWKWVSPDPITTDSSHMVGPIPCDETAMRRIRSSILRSARECVDDEVYRLAQEYELKCGSIDSLDEEFTVEIPVDYFHFTLYYYDRVGNLVRTVPPRGVHVLPTNATRESPTGHTFVTEYDYDSEGRMIRSNTPDGGESRVWYDEFGRLRFSQDARLTARGEYAYTKFDELGRVIESGVSTEDITDEEFALDENLNDPDFPYTGTERTYIAFDTASPDVYYIDLSRPQNLRNRVSRTWTDEGVATNYSYDIHGNVEWIAQEIPEFIRPEGPETAPFQYIRYEYDLISGNVNEVIYNEDRVDEFRHRYTYDRDNALVKVETSRDSIIWDTDARYEYYPHGPLRRIELGEDYVQGLDFVWALDGRLKGINHPSLDQSRDPSEDGSTAFGNSLVAADSFGLIINYHPYDFEAGGKAFLDYTTIPIPGWGMDELMPVPVFDGNISSIDLHIGKSTDTGKYEARIGTSYRYDHIGRLDSSRLHTFNLGDSTWNPFGQEYLTTYEYDANSNIVDLIRHGFTLSGSTQMDSLHYEYKTGASNQLDRVVEKVVAGDPYVVDLDAGQGPSNYEYDEIGNLVEDSTEGGMSMTWEAGGRVKSIARSTIGGNGQNVSYIYDAGGNRVRKQVFESSGGIFQTTSTYYVRDAVGTVVAIYEQRCLEESVGLPDQDGDGIPDQNDICPSVYDPNQLDFDNDGIGDACDPDDDNDGTADGSDPCIFDPFNACLPGDADGDGIPDGIDNCPITANPGQEDQDNDLIGDACDGDIDGDDINNHNDPCPYDPLDLCDCTLQLVEFPIYGQGRVGVAHPDIDLYADVSPTTIFSRDLGEKSYELTDHLGNVRGVISDRKLSDSPGTGDYYAEFTSYTNQYAYGMPQPGRSWDSVNLRYRYGFNGMESDPEVKLEDGQHMTTFFRQYDPRVARWWSNDPVTHSWLSPYNAMDANPVFLADPSGANGSPGSEKEKKPEPMQGLGDFAGSAGSGSSSGAGNSGSDEGRRREAAKAYAVAASNMFRAITQTAHDVAVVAQARESVKNSVESIANEVTGGNINLSHGVAPPAIQASTNMLIASLPPPPTISAVNRNFWDDVNDYAAQADDWYRIDAAAVLFTYSVLDNLYVVSSYTGNLLTGGPRVGLHLHNEGGYERGGNDMVARYALVGGMALNPGVTSVSSSTLAVSSTASRTLIIGENMMERVIPFAEATGSEHLGFGVSAARWSAMSPRARYQLNDGMLRQAARQATSVRSLGVDPRRLAVQRAAFDLTGSEHLRLQVMGINVEMVPSHEIFNVIGRP